MDAMLAAEVERMIARNAAEHAASRLAATDRYVVARVNGRNVHLIDTRIPEPTNGGRTQIACDLFTAGAYDVDVLGTMADSPSGHGIAAATWPLCRRCQDIAWRDLP